MATVSMVTTANNIRYGNAKTELVSFAWGTGVDGLDITGVGGLSISTGERAGEDIVRDPAKSGVGAMMGPATGGLFGDDDAEDIASGAEDFVISMSFAVSPSTPPTDIAVSLS